MTESERKDEELRILREQARQQAIANELLRRQLLLQVRAYRRANRSWYEKLESALFDW